MIQPGSSPIPTAQYLRKSDEQRYSIDNQRVAIKEYANSHGFAIVKQLLRSPAKSGAADRRKLVILKLVDVEAETIGDDWTFRTQTFWLR